MEASRADLSTVYRLAYVSRASSMFGEDDLAKIGQVSSRNNSEADITGILIMDEGNILQILEGEKNSVLSLFEKISKDPRHEGVKQVAGSEKGARILRCWSLVSGNGSGTPESLRHEFQLFYAKLRDRETIADISDEEVELLKVIALFRSVPL